MIVLNGITVVSHSGLYAKAPPKAISEFPNCR